MDRKDEIIQLQNEIMQGLLKQRMQLISEDLWGLKPENMMILCFPWEGILRVLIR